jgi:hypothetical protein
MCCFFTSLLFFGPRLAFLVYWLIPVGRLRIFAAFNTWIWPTLGLIFLPWATLTYVLLFPMVWFDWIFFGLALLADIASYAGGARSRRDVPGYSGP